MKSPRKTKSALKDIIIGVRNCARCSGDHDLVVFKPFKRALQGRALSKYTHWAMCDNTNEPILLANEDV